MKNSEWDDMPHLLYSSFDLLFSFVILYVLAQQVQIIQNTVIMPDSFWQDNAAELFFLLWGPEMMRQKVAWKDVSERSLNNQWLEIMKLAQSDIRHKKKNKLRISSKNFSHNHDRKKISKTLTENTTVDSSRTCHKRTMH